MIAKRESHTSGPQAVDHPLWCALRPEVRLGELRWSDLRLLADQQRLLPIDYVWHPAFETWRLAADVPGLFPPPRAGSDPSLGPEQASRKPSLKERARHELRSYLIVSAYIWSMLSLLRLHDHLMAETYQFSLQSQGRAVITALILGKVVLIAEALQLGNYLGRRLPALSVAIRSMLFALAILCFHAGEELAFALWDGRTLASAFAELSFETVRRSCILALIMTIALIPYFLIKEIEKRTGQHDLLLLAVGLKR